MFPHAVVIANTFTQSATNFRVSKNFVGCRLYALIILIVHLPSLGYRTEANRAGAIVCILYMLLDRLQVLNLSLGTVC